MYRYNSGLAKKWKLLAFLVVMTVVAPLFFNMTLPVNASPTPKITLDQNWGYYDQSIHIQGTNFSPNAVVSINWSTLSYWKFFANANAIGAFDIWLNVPTGLNAGNYTIAAFDQFGNSASANFALYNVYVNPGSFGIKSQKQLVQWNYDNGQFYCDLWQFYHNSYGGWYTVLNHDYGEYALRLTYNGVTYVSDLVGQKFNAWPNPLVEKVVGFSVKDVNHIQGKIQIFDPTGSTLLATIIMDIYAPSSAQNYYAIIFSITAETKLDNLAFYADQNLDVWQTTPNWAYYDNKMDAVYQYYGPTQSNPSIPQQYAAYAGFASVNPASTHHDAAIYYTDVQYIASNLKDNDFNYKDRNEAIGDAFGDCGIGLQWITGPMNTKNSITIPITYAVSDQTIDSFKATVTQGKQFAYQQLSKTPTITLSSNQGPSSSIINVSGQNFISLAHVNLCFGGISVGSLIADSSGAFQGSFITPTSVAGNYALSAVDECGLSASSNFVITDTTGNLLNQINANNAQLIAQLNSIGASITKLVTDSNGQVLAQISTSAGDITAKLDQINATITSLVTNVNGTISAKIDTAVGTIQTKLSDLNASITKLVTDSNGQVLAQISTSAGDITAKLDQINATITSLVTNVNGTISAKIDTAVGTIQTKLSDLNASITKLVTDSNGQVLAQISTSAGDITAKLDQINATITSLVTNVNGTISAKIDTAVGTIQTKLSDLNASITKVLSNVNGTLSAQISTSIGNVSVKLNDLNASITKLVTDSNGQIIAQINTAAGSMNAAFDSIKPKLVTVQGRTATIQTDIGPVKTDVGNVNGQIIALDGDTVTIGTNVGTIKTNLDSINPQTTISSGNIATIQTDIGTIKGNVTSVQNGIATVRTELGTVTTRTTGGNNTTQASVLILIGFLFALALVILALRKTMNGSFSKLKQNAKLKLRTEKSMNQKETPKTISLLEPEHKSPLIPEQQNLKESQASIMSCPSCGKTFDGPVVKLDFSGGEAKLVNVCPYCNQVLSKTESEKEIIQEKLN